VLEEQLHTRTGFIPEMPSSGFIPDMPSSGFNFTPPGGEGNGGSFDMAQVWGLLPHVKHLPTAMLRNIPNSVIFQLNEALAREAKMNSKMSVSARLTSNAQQLVLNPVGVPAGSDDRKNCLHPARFLGGACCSAQHLWLQARDVLGVNGVTAIGNYDLDSVGCGGSVTPRGWEAIHNPSSPDLKLKLFFMPNVGNSRLSTKKIDLEDGEKALTVGDSMKEIGDMDGFRAALNTAREAMSCALPWNRSIAAIQGFLINSNYAEADLRGNLNRAAMLTEFVDFVFARNALNWENKVPFLAADDLAHAWASWKGQRAAYFTASTSEKPKQSSTVEKKQKFSDMDDICRRFNRKDCKNSASDCKTWSGRKLKHVCSEKLANGRRCRKDHARVDHK